MNNLDDDSKVKRGLDTLDEVRQLFRGELAGKDKEFFDETIARIPQYIVTGAQSAGKSSVLGRISGVKLPEMAKRCTRVAIILKLRRQPQESIEVELKRFGDGEQPSQKFECEGNVATKAIEAAQALAIQESGDKEFAENFSVDVYVTGPNLPNVTLVDLPGFTNSTKEDTESVKRIVLRYLAMEGTMAMHVGRGDNDYNALLGNDIVRDYSDKLINVFTYCDALESLSKDKSAGYLDTILESTNGPRYVILGNLDAADVGEEENKLRSNDAFNGFRDKFQFGARALGQYLEENMARYMSATIPNMTAALKGNVASMQKRRKEIALRPAAGVVLEVIQTINARLDQDRVGFHNALAKLIASLTRRIKNLGLRCVDEDEPTRRLLPFELANGLELETPITGKNLPAGSTFHSYSQADFFVSFDSELYQVPKKDIRVYESEPAHVCAEIENVLGDTIGLRNISHADPQAPLEYYAKDFAERYNVILTAALLEFASLTKKRIEAAFSMEGVTDMGKNVMSKLHKRARAVLGKQKKEMESWIEDIVAWNKAPLVFTPNEYALGEAFHELTTVKAENGTVPQVAETDLSKSMVMYYKIQTYLKIQRNILCEAAGKQFTLVFNNKVENKVKGEMTRKIGGLEELVLDPIKWKEERDRLSNRIEVLEKGIQKLENLYADVTPHDTTIMFDDESSNSSSSSDDEE